jgi:hypothetical protein
MAIQQHDLDIILRRLGVTHCSACGVQITPDTVVIGWNPRAGYDAVLPIAWLTCSYNRCATHITQAPVNLCGRFATSEQEAIDALKGL